jgi:5-methylcytosine-specific restriction endonuclease McrA
MIPKPRPKRKGTRAYKWKKLRDAYLVKNQAADGLWQCAHCKKLITAPELDHIIKRSVRPDLVFVESNLQILCGWSDNNCHGRKDSGFRFD